MSSPSSPTLICDVDSRRAERWIALLALAAPAAVPFLIPAPGLAAGGALLGALLLVRAGLRQAGWIGGGRRIRALSWSPDGRWLLIDARHTPIRGTLRVDSRAGSRWVWLRWDTDDPLRRSRSLLLFAGDLPARQLRRLIVRLRIEGSSQFTRGSDSGRGRPVPGPGLLVS